MRVCVYLCRVVQLNRLWNCTASPQMHTFIIDTNMLIYLYSYRYDIDVCIQKKDHCSLCSCAVSHKLHKVKTTSKHTKCHIFTMHTPAFKHSHFYLNTLHFTPVTYEHILPVPSHYRLPVWLLVCLYHIGFGLWQAKLHRRHGNRKTRNDLFHKCFTARKTQYWNSIHRKQEF